MRETLTQKQNEQYFGFVKDVVECALNKMSLDEDRLQRLIKNRGEFQEAILMAVTKISNKFADEEMKSNSHYPVGYKPRGIAEQVKCLRELFPDLSDADEKLAEQDLPLYAEAWFAIPRWEKIAPTYCEALQKVLDRVKKVRSNWFLHDFGPSNLRQLKKSAKAIQKLELEQKNHDILVVPAQFGLRHQGRSIQRAREVMNDSEFGLGAYAVGIMLLTHPERLQHLIDFQIHCAGDEHTSGCYDDFRFSPHYMYDGGWYRETKFQFSMSWINNADSNSGSASGFLQ